jgi:subtilisin-like proprotein convertase family protein
MDYTESTDQILGTSFAAPQAAAVAALILQKNPNLTWRDVRHIIARTAVQIQPAASSWRTLPVPPGGSAPLHWSPDFGFGRIDAAAAVAKVAGWALLPAQSAPLQATATTQASETSGSVAIPDGTDVGVGADLAISADADFRVEEVEFAATVAHADQSQLTYTLISPAGTKSVVVGRPLDQTAARVRVFTSLGHWGERANGTWRVTVSDRKSGVTGTVGGVAISIFGYRESTAPGNASSGGSSGTAGLTTTNDPFLLPHAPSTAPSTSGDSGGGLCGLGSGSMALFVSGLLAFLLRRNLRA